MSFVPIILCLFLGAIVSDAQLIELQPKQTVLLDDGKQITIELVDSQIFVVEGGVVIRVGGDSSGGGDFVAQEVASIIQWVISQLHQINIPDHQKEARLLATRFEGLVSELNIVVAHRLVLDSTEVSAINQPEQSRLFISRQLWVERAVYSEKAALILHELFGLAGLPDQDYSLSNKWAPLISRDYSVLRPATHSTDEDYQRSKEAILACAPQMKAHARVLAEKLGPHFDGENLNIPQLMEPGVLQKIIENPTQNPRYSTKTVRDISPEKGRYAEANGDECVMTTYPNTYTVTCTTSVVKDGAKSWESVIPIMKLRYFYQRETKTCLPTYYPAGRQYYSKRPPYLEIPHFDYLESSGGIHILTNAVKESVNGMYYVEKWLFSNMRSWVRTSELIPAYFYKKSKSPKTLIGKTLSFNFDYVEYKPERDEGPFYRTRDSCPRTNCTYSRKWAGPMAGFLSNLPESQGLSRRDELFLTMVYHNSVHWEGSFPDLISPEAAEKARAFYMHRGLHDKLPGPISDQRTAQLQRYMGFAGLHSEGLRVIEDKSGMVLPGESVGQWVFIPKGSRFKVVGIDLAGVSGYSSNNEFAFENTTKNYNKITLTLESPTLGTIKYDWGGGDYVYGEEVFVPFHMNVIE